MKTYAPYNIFFNKSQAFLSFLTKNILYRRYNRLYQVVAQEINAQSCTDKTQKHTTEKVRKATAKQALAYAKEYAERKKDNQQNRT